MGFDKCLTGSYGESTFSFVINCLLYCLPECCTSLHSHQQRMKVPFVPHPWKHWYYRYLGSSHSISVITSKVLVYQILPSMSFSTWCPMNDKAVYPDGWEYKQFLALWSTGDCSFWSFMVVLSSTLRSFLTCRYWSVPAEDLGDPLHMSVALSSLVLCLALSQIPRSISQTYLFLAFSFLS